MKTYAIARNQQIGPIHVTAGGIVNVTTTAPGYVTLEFTSDPLNAVQNGVAKWVKWPERTVTSAFADMAAESGYLRATARSGAATMSVNNCPSPEEVKVYQREFVGRARADNRPLGNTAVIIGDSNSYQNFAQAYIASASRSNGIVTVTFTSPASIPFGIGMPVQVVGLPEDMRGNQVVTSATSTTITYDNAGPDVASAPLYGTPSVANMACYMDNGWFVWANVLSNQRFDLMGISAAVGRTTSEMLDRVDEVANINASYAFVMGGTNDATGGATPESIQAKLQAIYERLLASGKKIVYAMTILPLGAGNGAWSAPKTATILKVNDWIKQYCRNTPGMQCIDAFAEIVDPTAANKGQAAAGLISSVDGLHLTQRGAHKLGKRITADTATLPSNDFRTTSNADNYGTNAANRNVQDSAPWSVGGDASRGDAGSVIGTGFTGFKINSPTNCLFSAPARADGFGVDNKADITAAAAGDGARFQGSSLAAQRITDGATVQLDVSVSVTGNGSGKFKSLNHLLSMSVNGSAWSIQAMGNFGNTGADCVQEDWTGVLRTPAVRMPIAPAAGSITRTDCTLLGAGSMSFTAGRGQILVTPA
ncbi:lysophospholipase L1-like esterase [Pseudoduganella flava]|uniref:Lysophospholipase L1-like esterase n=1 Tax=Pseudoduganella flava TaxID=871742 RepID=A0A562P9G6_9BURK|nr:SGNH/GDSL hydrolase family protein [Pseudoduganella flava]QGZ42708.1 hypothetical protein GO485_29195 [Pseudoduganella flava]TWI41039.1 lysophospholipase L1-like esterase [Pseudoduganella flava]